MTKGNLLIGINIILCLLFLGDAFKFPAKEKTVSINNLDSKLTRSKGRDYYNYFMHTSDHCKYEVSENMYRELGANDTVNIFSSPVIGMPRAIRYKRYGHEEVFKIGQLNSKGSLEIGLYISLIISIYLLIRNSIKPYGTRSVFFGLQVVAIGISITVFLFVMIEVWST